jgi:hypothetical protein
MHVLAGIEEAETTFEKKGVRTVPCGESAQRNSSGQKNPSFFL